MGTIETIGDNIRLLRTTKGWSQEKLAIRAKLSLNYVSLLERSKVNISISSLDKIAKCLGVDTYVLLIKKE